MCLARAKRLFFEGNVLFESRNCNTKFGNESAIAFFVFINLFS